MGNTLKVILALGLAVATGIAGYISYRNNQIERLYAEAAGYPQFFRGTAQSTEAVKKLATYRGQRVTEKLLEIALGQGPFIWGDTRTSAIRALEERNNSQVASAVADLLQPQEGLHTRQAAAEALLHLPCKAECIRSIMHYLERVWWGEPNYEDRDETVRPPEFQNATATFLKSQQTLLYSSLYSVLQREKVETYANLVKVYGLGTDAPSPFALDLVSRLGMHEACPLLLQSQRAIQKLPSGSYKAPRQELEASITSLNCK
jgi:hypothetical protein